MGRFGWQQDATRFTLLLAVFHVLLHRYTGIEASLVATSNLPSNPQTRPRTGPLGNLIRFPIEFSGDTTFRKLWVRVRNAWESHAIHNSHADMSRTSVFRLRFDVQDFGDAAIAASHQIQPHEETNDENFELTAKIRVTPQHLFCAL